MTAPVFPDAPLEAVVELFVLGGWTDITADVQTADKIRITRGRANNSSGQPPPSKCQMRINNRSGKYSPRNPMGPYYGTLQRNTPIRVSRRLARDAFGRTVSNGWSSADVGGAWSFVGAAGDFAVGSGVGTMAISTTSTFHLMYQGSQLYRDVDVAATVTLPFSDVLGGNVEPCNLVLSGLSTSDYFMVSLKITTAEALTIAIDHVDGTNVAPTITVPGITYTGQALRVRLAQDGQTLRAKVWPAGTAEPYAWTIAARTDRLARRASGWVGIRSGVGSGNTNIPVTFSYDDFEVRSTRFVGEVAKFPPQWDVSGNNVFTQIEAAGPRRRLGQGQTPLKSTFLRGNQNITPAHVGYWPCEDGAGSTSIASGLPNGVPMKIIGAPTFASYSGFVGSAPLPFVNGAFWEGLTPGATNTGKLQAIFLLSIASGGETNDDAIFRLNTTGTAAFFDLAYATGGEMYFRWFDQSRNIIGTSSTTAGLGLNGRPLQVSIELTQNGANIDYVVATWFVGDSGGALSLGGTIVGQTIGTVQGCMASQYRQMGSQTAIGHIAIRTSITSIFTLADQLKAYSGELAVPRALRLGTENTVNVSYVGDGGKIASAALGTQARSNLLDLFDESADTEFGSFYDSRSYLGFVFRQRSSVYNQNPALALDYTVAGHVPPPLLPVEDDQALRNDITVTRKGGSSDRATQTTGPLAVTAPTDGTGVGRYDDAVELNLATDDQVPDTAGWALHLGTVDEARFPSIKVALAKLTKVGNQLALDALSVDLDDRITIANLPLYASPDLVSQLARGYTEELNLYRHDITFNCAPASPYELVQLDSTARQKIDSDTSTLAGAITSTATKLVVVDSAHFGWTTSAPAMPIPITLAGENMSVTAVSVLGASFRSPVGVASEGSNAPRTPALPVGWAEGDALYCRDCDPEQSGRVAADAQRLEVVGVQPEFLSVREDRGGERNGADGDLRRRCR